MSDRELARRMLDGHEQAFGEFFDDHFPRLYRFALPRLGQDADATEEVVQTTLIKGIAGLRTYRGDAALFTWLCTICRREIQAHHERRGRLGATVPLIEEAPEVRAALEALADGLATGPEGALQRRDVVRLVQATLDCLPRAYAAALEGKYIQGLSVKEIAVLHNLGAKAAESLLTRARAAFREGFAAVCRGRREVDA